MEIAVSACFLLAAFACGLAVGIGKNPPPYCHLLHGSGLTAIPVKSHQGTRDCSQAAMTTLPAQASTT